MRKLIKKAHDSLDRIEDVLEAVKGRNEEVERSAWLDAALDNNWTMYYIDKNNAVAMQPMLMRYQ